MAAEHPGGFSPDRPAPARVYNYILGGKDNFAADRAAVERILSFMPDYATVAHHNREFIRRAVTKLVRDEGIDQIIDIGAGIPAPGATHEVAHAINPDVGIVYVDNDPIVLTHARGLIDGPRVHTIVADLRDPLTILDHPELAGRIDWSRPVGVLLVAVLHFIADDEDPDGIVATIRDRVAPGSWLVLSHATASSEDDAAEGMADQANFGSSVAIRPREHIERLFTGWRLDGPVVTLGEWAVPDPRPITGINGLAGIAVKPPAL